jgi:hypothetical protein
MSNGFISFRQIRRTAEVVRQSSAFRCNNEQLTKALLTGLLPDVGSADDQIRIQVKLAILELQRLSGLDLDIDATLDSLAYELHQNKLNLLSGVISAEYDNDQMTTLVDWLIRRIGSQASSAMAAQENKNRRDRKAKDQQRHEVTFESASVLLDYICQMSPNSYPHLIPSYFNVVALDLYIKANKDSEDILQSCCRFSSLLSLSTKLDLLSSDFARRQRRWERDQMYADIYAGSNYQREANGDLSKRRCLEVDRMQILITSRELLDEAKGSLSNGIHIIFTGEEGQDAGGLVKEWLLLLCKELVPLVFCQAETEAPKYEIRADSSPSDTQLMGIVIGLSIRHRIPLDVAIPNYVYGHIFSRPDPSISTVKDLSQIRPVLAKGLTEMLSWDEAGFSQRLSLNFTYHPSLEGQAVPLIPNGDKISVSYSNRDTYVDRLCSYILLEQSQEQLDAIHYGLEQVCHDLQSLQLFSIGEIDGLVCGQEIPLNVACLRRISSVDPPSRLDGYIDDFWSVLEQANDPAILRRLLHFVTANDRIPLTSSPQESATVFRIVILQGQEFTERLPTASTCTNTLFLPRYPTIEQLRVRLFTALHQGSIGFGLK